jgi:hypothetical protein
MAMLALIYYRITRGLRVESCIPGPVSPRQKIAIPSINSLFGLLRGCARIGGPGL